MSEETLLIRRRAAAAAEEYLRGDRSWESFVEEFRGIDDELVDEVVYLIEHEPRRGFLGITKKGLGRYRDKVRKAVEALNVS